MYKTTSHRLFYALRPDDVARDALASAVSSLQENHAEALRWTPAENRHVTLKFVGAVAGDRISDLCDCLHRAARSTAPVNIHFDSIEPFPSPQHAVVLAATGTGCAAAKNLVRELESCCSGLGWPVDTREWRCHLTLARVLDRDALSFAPVDINVAFTASEISLLESTIVDCRVNYLPVATAALLFQD